MFVCHPLSVVSAQTRPLAVAEPLAPTWAVSPIIGGAQLEQASPWLGAGGVGRRPSAATSDGGWAGYRSSSSSTKYLRRRSGCCTVYVTPRH